MKIIFKKEYEPVTGREGKMKIIFKKTFALL
jgi:hypothetical protein